MFIFGFIHRKNGYIKPFSAHFTAFHAFFAHFLFFTFLLSNNKEVIGDRGSVGRFGGDEFVVLFRETRDRAINELMDRLTAGTEKIRVESDPDYRLHFSAGMACCPSDASDYNSLMRCADRALYNVKENGRNGWQRYKKEQKA